MSPTPERTLVIAEAGVNHNGSLDLALRLVDVAADAGADVVKFQTFQARHLVTAQASKARYQVDNTGESGSQMEMLRRLELGRDAHHVLLARCRERGIRFMSTAFDDDSLQFLGTLDMPAVKIPSGDATHAPMLLKAARLGRPVILSTGMCTLADVEAALGVLAFALTQPGQPRSRRDFEAAWCDPAAQAVLRERVTVLHCVTDYPAAPASVHLRAMDTLATAFGLPVGYSDHTLGHAVALAAVARGARVIEKHFTLDRTLPGPDHAASLQPDELRDMVAGIRTIEQAVGGPAKRPSPVEVDNRAVARRSVVAARPVARGAVLTWDDLAFKRPGTGVSPLDAWGLVGRVAARDYEVDDLIEP